MSTYFIGKILDPVNFCIKLGLDNLIRGLIGTFKKDFEPRKYPHITLIYIGSNEYKLKKIINDNKLRKKLQEFNNARCLFKKLDFYGKTLVYVFEFEDNKLNDKINKIMEKYNPGESHNGNRLHIAIGKFSNNKATDWFKNNLMNEMEEIIKGTYKGEYVNEFTDDINKICKLDEFIFDYSDIIEVTKNKEYIALEKI